MTYGFATPGRAAISNAQQTELDLTISEGLVRVAAPRVRKLICDPPSGDHPHPEMACHDVAAAEGDLARLPGEPGKVCSGLYKPVTVTALGEWRGVPVRFGQSYRNACKLMASTGLVFDF
ncbi:hypothetical protein JOF56_003798 [Kibdelosporangium banguiense]|uniref:Subtilisin inhibitor domain-containing protein n=1 Tax=Kibdelosporangium banguiense TaxID=1365924 RepID=A0ABS4TG60_9PSEU|nr:SSI family serine proteinase inhibitor [Kibdelosporangium banguiense]MBP2323413.1 hypothetical protein [Kibdelosporangium banguiense]